MAKLRAPLRIGVHACVQLKCWMHIKCTRMRVDMLVRGQREVGRHSYLTQPHHQYTKRQESPLRTTARLISTHSGRLRNKRIISPQPNKEFAGASSSMIFFNN